MKKLNLIVLAAVVAAMLVGCGGSTPKADLKTEVDTLSYSFGLAQSRGLKEYLAGRLGIDTAAYMRQFIQGVKDGVKAGKDDKKLAYFAGLQIGQQIANQMVPGMNRELFDDDTTKTVSTKNIMAGLLAGAKGTNMSKEQEEATNLFRLKMEVIKDRVINERYGPNKAAGEKFLAENAKKEGVVTLPSGVQYRILKEGDGPIPTDSSQVLVNYEGRLLNDTVFDSSYKRGTPTKFYVNRLIKGWSEALQHMPVGSEWEIYIPQELAYGNHKQAKMDPFSALIFKVELVGIEDKDKDKNKK